MSRSVDWVEQDLHTGVMLWRQGKRETGQFPVTYTDRRSDFLATITKKATKTKPATSDTQPRYTEAEKKQLSAIFDPLVKAMTTRYGSFVWWHYDYPTGTLLYGGQPRQQVQANDIVKLADQSFTKFAAALSKLHGHKIGPARDA